MGVTLEQLTLHCREGDERVVFDPTLSFFHGEMSAGKSTIVQMVNFCMGGRPVKTPAVSSEVVGAQLLLNLGDSEVLLERSMHSPSRVDVTWSLGDKQRLDTLPISAAEEPLIGDDVFNLSDFLLRQFGLPLLKTRQRKADADSDLRRVSFRDFFKFIYLDQDNLDSSFFLLDTPIRQEKSKDVLRYVLGLHSDRLGELEIELHELRQRQRTIRGSAKEIDEFLGRYGFNSEAAISERMKDLQVEAAEIEEQLNGLSPDSVPDNSLGDELQMQLDSITKEIESANQALRDVQEQLRDQEALRSELLSLKFKVARTALASRVLEGAEFQLCPACGSELQPLAEEDVCYLCHADFHGAARRKELDSMIVERDLTERVDDLDRSSRRLDRSRARQEKRLKDLIHERARLQRRVDQARQSVESQYFQRVRALEARLGAVTERRSFLEKVLAMPSEIEAKWREADQLSEEISRVHRVMEQEQEKFSEGRTNVSLLEENFLSLLLAIHFPGISQEDSVSINTKTWMPYVLPNGNSDRGWTFGDAGSGGKKTMFKIVFALALHLTVAQRSLSLPRLLIIDSTMKNITPDINPEIVNHFYGELYRLLSNELRGWQFVLVDQTYFPPTPETGITGTHRLMTKDDPEHPPLISYYKGH